MTQTESIAVEDDLPAVALFDQARTLVQCDARFPLLLQVPEHDVRPGTTLDALLARAGPAYDDAREALLDALSAHHPPRACQRDWRRPDGTRVTITLSPLPDGALVLSCARRLEAPPVAQQASGSPPRALPPGRESELRRLLEDSPLGVSVTLHDEASTGVMAQRVFANQALADLFGYETPADVIAEDITKNWADSAQMHVVNEKMRRGEELDDLETLRSRRDGSRVWISITTRPIVFEGRRTTMAWHVDVTARKQAEAELRRSEQRFRDFAETASDWMWETDAALRFIYFSENVEQVVGVPAAWHYGKTREDLLGPDYDRATWDAHLEALQRREPFRNFTYLRHGAGVTPRWLRVSGMPVYDPDGGFLGYRGTGSDVTAEVELTMRAQRAEHRFRDALEAIDQGFVVFDADDRFVLCNGRYREINHHFAEMLVPGETFEAIIRRSARHREFAEQSEEEWVAARIASHRQADGGTFEQWHRDGRCIRVEDRRSSVGDFVGIRTDITELKRREAALKQAHDELEARVATRTQHLMAEISERQRVEQQLTAAKEEAEAANQAKSDFLSRMSHELRTPLNAILGFGQLLQISLDAEKGRQVSHILSAGRHLLDLIDEILDLSRIETGQVTASRDPVSLAMLIDDCVADTRAVADTKDLTIEFPLAPIQPGHVRGDPKRLRQVLTNLLSNAIKYSDDGDCVRIAVAPSSDGMARISVTDTAGGIQEDDRARIFEPFTRLHGDGWEGTGIGLTIAKQLIEVMGGRIGLDSVVGAGSTFWIELPVVAGRDAGAARDDPGMVQVLAAPGDEPRRAGTRKLVFYVEDNRANQTLMHSIVARMGGVDLVMVDTAEEGLERLASLVPDLILMDISLPGMDGFAALRAIRAMPHLNAVAVIAVSANAMPQTIAEGRAAGFSDYIVKPFEVATIIDKICEALGDR